MTETVNGEKANAIRIVCIYATHWRYKEGATGELHRPLNLGRLRDYYEVYKDQLPRLLSNSSFDTRDIRLSADVEGLAGGGGHLTVFALPSNQVVIAVDLHFAAAPLRDKAAAQPIAAALDQCIHGDLRINGQLLPAFVEDLDHGGLLPEGTGNALLPERHLLVLVNKRSIPPGTPVPSDDVIDDIVFREEPPYREEFTTKRPPEQLNLKGPSGKLITLGVVTPYVSLIYGHDKEVEDSIFLSTVQAVGTSSRFRQIWLDAYQKVRDFREHKQSQQVGEQTRDQLEDLADSLGNLEFDLTFSVEFPLMRIESFHSALYEAMDLPVQAQALSQMFAQLGGSLRSEITAIDIRERRREDGRQKWNSTAAGILSLIGVSVGFVVAFFGINASQVTGGISMWDPRYAGLYQVAGTFALIPVALIAFPYMREWSLRHKPRESVLRGGITLAVAVILGVAALLDDAMGPTWLRIIDAFAESFAGFALLAALTLFVLAAVSRKQPVSRS